MKKISINNLINSDRKILYVILSVVLISIFSLTIVYAALFVSLNITGNAEVVASSWDIHLDNVQLNSQSATTTAPSITNATTASFSTTLNMPGDFYEFTIDVVNDGSIDAMIDSVTKTPTLSTEQAKYLNYIVEYQNGEAISTKQLVAKESFVRLKVRVEYRSDITSSDISTTSETLNLAFTVNYVQSDGSASSVTDNGVWVIKADGSLDDIGTIVTIGSEQFYTIGTEGDKVKLLSMYNLHVGNSVDENFNITPLENSTGMQSSSARGSYLDSDGNCVDFPYIGITNFSSDTQKGTNYSDYNGSIVEGYVNNYKTLLESNFGLSVEEARLITYDELTDTNTFACVGDDFCSDKYPWIYSTAYYTGSASRTDTVWSVFNDGYFTSIGDPVSNSDFGVRPVIAVSKSNF